MPRANTTDDEAVVPKKRAPRKRVVEAGETPAPRPRAPRRPRVTESAVREVESAPSEPIRKAPTPLRAERTRGKRSARALVIALGLCGLVATGGVMVGMTDGGQIDVVAVVNERNEKIGRGEVRDEQGNPITATVPVQNADTRPNGGLTPMDPSETVTPPPPPPEPVATTTASTTEETAPTENDESTTEPESEPEVTEAAAPSTDIPAE